MGHWIAIYEDSTGALGYCRFESTEWSEAYRDWLSYRINMKFSCTLRALIVDDGALVDFDNYGNVKITLS